MNSAKMPFVILLVLAAAFVAWSSVFTVQQHQKAILLQLGKIVESDFEPGIHLMVPFVQEVKLFDRRILSMDAEPVRYFTVEKKNVMVDAYVQWRISGVERFYVSTSGGDEQRAVGLLEKRVEDALRSEFARRSVKDVISGERVAIMESITKAVSANVKDLGIEIVDVRVKKIDLPEDVNQAVYDRMSAERTRVAQDLRSKGKESAERIKADTDRQVTVLLAEAYRDSEKVRGDGDAKSAEIYAQAYNQNREFYSFYRSLNAYRTAFGNQGSMMVMDPNSEFFQYLKNPATGTGNALK